MNYDNRLPDLLDFTVTDCYNYGKIKDTVNMKGFDMKTAIYLRVSTTEQAEEGFGIAAQRAKCYAMAEVKGWDVVQEFIDEGISGSLDETGRPGLAAMLSAVCDGELNSVIVAALDRLGRSTRVILDLVEAMSECKAEIVSCKESLDTSTPTGMFVLTMFAALAALDRANIVERTTAGRNERGKVDGDRGGKLPMGYIRTETGLAVVPGEAETVRRILAARLAGTTLTEIAERLNASDTTTRSGGRWYASSVREILLNEDKYRGGYRGESSERWPIIFGEMGNE